MQHLKDIIRVKNEEPLWAWTEKTEKKKRKKERKRKKKEKKEKKKTKKNKKRPIITFVNCLYS